MLPKSSSRARAHARRWVHSQQLVRDALREAHKQLQSAAALPASAAGDAKPLLASALRPRLRNSSDVFLHLDRQLTQGEAETLSAALARRCRGEPLAYVTGSREFWSLPLRVSPSTLIPRSDSEVLVETLAAQYAKQSALRILDVGTGSGCLLLAALAEFPHARGVGIDVSDDALRVAQQNADDLALAPRAQFLQYDLRDLPRLDAAARSTTTTAATAALFQQFDAVLCNPPYIPRGELHLVADDVLAHEPHLALFSDGPDAVRRQSDARDEDDDDDPQGLRMYRWLQQSVGHVFKPPTSPDERPRSLIVEIGSEAQAQAVQALFAAPSTRHLVFQRFLVDGQRRPRGLLFQTS